MPDIWTLRRGANVEAGGTRFSVWAPNAKAVAVRLAGGGKQQDHPLEAVGKGVFEALVPGVRAGADYRYVLDGERDLPDPVSRWQPEGVHGPSRVIDPNAHRWADQRWTGLEMADHVIYELHVGTFSAAGTFDGVAGHLAEVRETGVTAIEIMPVAEFPGGRNWGYDGVHPYAVQSTYGGPEGLRRLVGAAHDAGLAVILDVVYNHLGPEGNYLGAYGPYFTETYRTPWGPALNYDGRDSDEVRRYFIDNALYWITEYHIDGLRLDAIHGIYDFGATHILREIVDAVHTQADQLGRRVQLIAESDLNDPRVVRGERACGHGFDAQWADDLHHAIHAAVTAETNGYYADFGGMEPVAKALQSPFVYQGAYSAHRRRRHGAPPTGVSNDHFIVCIQNHDQVGNRAAGERLAALVSPERYRLAAALYLLSAHVPMLFMGEEYGETNPFQFFVSHGDAKLLEAVRKGRREEFAAFGWGENVPDPGAESTFAASRLERARSGQPGHRETLALYRALLRARREERALRPGSAEQRVAYDGAGGWISLELLVNGGAGRGAPPENDDSPSGAAPRNRNPAPVGISPNAGDLLALFNMTDRETQVPVAPTKAGRWRLRLSTDDADFGGGDRVSRALAIEPDGGARISLPPFTAALYRREND